jgi:hypothetical protein
MFAIVTAKIETTKPPIEGQPVRSNDQWIPAARPPTGLNANATKMPMTMTTFKIPNANANVAAAKRPTSAVIAHVPHHVQRSRHNVESRHAPAKWPNANVKTVVASRNFVATRETIFQLFFTKIDYCKCSFRLRKAVAHH